MDEKDVKNIVDEVKNRQTEGFKGIEAKNEAFEKELEGQKAEIFNLNQKLAAFSTPREVQDDKNTEEYKEFKNYLMTGEIRNATVKTTDGYGVPTLVDGNVFKRRSLGSLMRKPIEGVADAQVRTYGADTKVTVKVNPTAAIIAEGADYANGSDAGSQVTFDSIKMGSIYSVTEEVAEETVINVISDFEDDAGKALAKLENQYFFVGTGSDQPQGILVGGTAAVTAASASAITYDELVTLDEALPAEYQDGACYFCDTSTRAVLRKIKDSNSRPILQEYNNGLMSLFGKPLVINSGMPDFGAGAKVLCVGNRSAYGIGDRKSGLKVRVSENTKNGDTEVRWSLRTDGKVLDATAFQYLTMHA